MKYISVFLFFLVTFNAWGQLTYFDGHEERINNIAKATTGKKGKFLTASYDGTVKIWSLKDFKQINSLDGHKNKVLDIAISHNGKYALTSDVTGTIILWNLSRKKIIKKFNDFNKSVNALAFSKNDLYFAAGGMNEKIIVWTLKSQEKFHTFTATARINTLAFSPINEAIIAVGNRDKTIQLWNIINKNNIRTYKGHQGNINKIVFSTDGKSLYSAGENIRKWDLSNPSRLNEIANLNEHKDKIIGLAYARNGILVSVSEDFTAIVWDTKQSNPSIIKKYTQNKDDLSFFTAVDIIKGGSLFIATHSDGRLSTGETGVVPSNEIAVTAIIPDIEVTWINPSNHDIVVEEDDLPSFKLQACIKANCEIEKIYLIVEGESYDLTRKYKEIGMKADSPCSENTFFVDLYPDFKIGDLGNEVVFKISDKKNNIYVSEKRTVIVKKSEKLDKEIINHLLLIGINNYKDHGTSASNWKNLNNPILDANALEEVLINKYTFEKENVVKIYNEAATKVNIERTLHKLNERFKNEKNAIHNLVIYFTGHGIKVDKVAYLVPYEANTDYIITSQYIDKAFINKFSKKESLQHLYLITDACFSGMVKEEITPLKGFNSKSRRVFTSSVTIPKDVLPGENSPFAKLLLQFLGLQKAHTPIHKLEEYLKNNLQGIVRPRDYPLEGDAIGEFFFILRR